MVDLGGHLPAVTLAIEGRLDDGTYDLGDITVTRVVVGSSARTVDRKRLRLTHCHSFRAGRAPHVLPAQGDVVR